MRKSQKVQAFLVGSLVAFCLSSYAHAQTTNNNGTRTPRTTTTNTSTSNTRGKTQPPARCSTSRRNTIPCPN